MNSIKYTLSGCVLALLLQGCESQQRTPPPMPPTAQPPSSSPPTPPSPPSSESKSSPPSDPSESSESKSSPPSSEPQTTTSAPPSMPQPSSDPSQSSPPSSPSSTSGKQDQEEAAESLKKAGQQVADAGEQLPGGPQSQPAQSSEGGGEWDPLIPDSDRPSTSDSDIFEESEETAAASGQPAESDPSADSGESGAAGEPDDMMMEEEPAQASGGSSGDTTDMQSQTASTQSGESGAQSESMPGDLADEIQAAQEALQQAGISLQTAGETLEHASTDGELAAAEADLARARVAVIVAGQDLLDIQDVFEGTDLESVIGEAQEALNEANVAIVIATDTIFSSRIELPEFEQRKAGGAIPGSGEGESELDKELNESIVVFENQILDARNEVLGSAPAPTSGDNIPGVAVLGGNVGEEGDGEGTFRENDRDEMQAGDVEVLEQGMMPEGSEVAAVDKESQPLVPDDIPDAQGDDIVAQQLREAAVSESDPVLRDKLWEEYKRYKAGL